MAIENNLEKKLVNQANYSICKGGEFLWNKEKLYTAIMF